MSKRTYARRFRPSAQLDLDNELEGVRTALTLGQLVDVELLVRAVEAHLERMEVAYQDELNTEVVHWEKHLARLVSVVKRIADDLNFAAAPEERARIQAGLRRAVENAAEFLGDQAEIDGHQRTWEAAQRIVKGGQC